FSDRHDATWDHAGQADYEQSPDMLEDDAAPMYGLDHDYDRIERGRPPVGRSLDPADHYREPRPPRSYRAFAVALFILLGVCALVYWQWSNVNGVYQFLSHMRSSQSVQKPAGEPKFAGRDAKAQSNLAPQRAVLYEEDSGNPQGTQSTGTA